MHNNEEYLTKEKFKELEKELEYIKTTRRKEIAEALEYAKSLGDFSENQEYQEARDNQAILEDRIGRLEVILKSAKIVSTQSTNLVSVGSIMTVEKRGDKSRKSYTMVGSEEADAAKGKISVRSPLGMAAMGKSKGETFSFETPNGMMSYKIIDIK
ncbi:MAG: transcription elongation factor GreA [Candidatus Zambryskibacteria bacterium RIFCSPHIGHO2_02_FULL_43_14]|uniref:Transcription elongation factor GreA n=1 Tax=Candidatus Zambryskibacteria bacterium RIFCSPHIGHO2_02_FULL_43_14 TaxID=1802748 RepID=A0A1G2TFG4_9BACT|nr:MAG: transcription elongation factor GreA [Candidatus Zambryskibacteria bacterium RIFCSPHIGHO2_01_FULL_43_60]OHA95922.1 MAG: transcription elongation factor GreA [Candidatus Zambryskibacteria bacterium RIFCSPHIGHO2_02_FULL_43_14]OHB03616.1 MAG: transcription elongation factor GreA [Candidatus Zambryskibacteria bacterium RIFCSPLOWO2_01_FULL_42_41]